MSARLRVLFGQAYYLRFDPKLWAAQQPYPPLGTLYAAAVARDAGHHVELFDAMLAGSESEWASALDRSRPDVAVLYEDSFSYLSKMCLLRMREAAVTMVGAARVRGVRVIVSGSDATDHAGIYLRAGADVVIAGEGEETLRQLLEALSLKTPGSLRDIRGIYVPDDRGDVRKTPPRDLIADLDALPRPAWDLVDVARYRRIWLRRHGYFSMSVATTRGCPYHCNWCAKPIYGQRYTARSPEHVAAEIAWLRAAYGPDHLWIADDIFGLKPGWIEGFADRIVEHGAATPFKCLLRADGVTGDRARDLRRAGCRTAWIGAESGSQRILDAMEKGTRIDQIRTATRVLRREGIEVGFFVQFGYPGETKEDIAKTLQMLNECRPDDIGVSVSYPLPGTSFHERVKAQLGAKQNWVDSDDLAMMYRGTYAPEFYRTLHGVVHAEHRRRRAIDAATRWAPATPRVMPREAAGALWQSLKLPFLRRRLDRLARASTDTALLAAPLTIPLLSQRAAAVPSDQPR